jgi:hypothetical protein
MHPRASGKSREMNIKKAVHHGLSPRLFLLSGFEFWYDAWQLK